MNELRDTDLREALRRREARRAKPQPSPDFADRVMKEIGPKPARKGWRMVAAALAAAACTALVVLTTWPQEEQGYTEMQIAEVKSGSPLLCGGGSCPVEAITRQEGDAHLKLATQGSRTTNPTKRKAVREQREAEEKPATPPLQEREAVTPPEQEPQAHYVAHELQEDTVVRLEPGKVDEFIARFADYYGVKADSLQCSEQAGENVESHVYVFPDEKEIDVFGRMLQVACHYGDDTPGYLLNFSHQQLCFQLKDLRRQQNYLWIAERLNGKILLYSISSPIGATVSPACYQEYRRQITHTTKTLEI